MSMKVETGNRYELDEYGEVEVISINRAPTGIKLLNDEESSKGFEFVEEEYSIIFLTDRDGPISGSRRVSLTPAEFQDKVEKSIENDDN